MADYYGSASATAPSPPKKPQLDQGKDINVFQSSYLLLVLYREIQVQ